jgi:hypothetical protein
MTLLSLLQITIAPSGPTNPLLFPSDLTILAVLLTKILFIIGALLYVIFAVLVTRQIHIMRTTVMTGFSPAVQALGFLHLGLAIMVLLLFILYL